MTCEPVGVREVAERLGVQQQTVSMWRYRKLMPPPRWTVSGQPAWDWRDIEAWAWNTNRKNEEMTMIGKKAIQFQVSDPEHDARYCVGTMVFDDATVAHTPVSDYSDLRRKATDHGLAAEEVVVHPQTVAWLKDREGWPEGSQTVGSVRP